MDGDEYVETEDEGDDFLQSLSDGWKGHYYSAYEGRFEVMVMLVLRKRTTFWARGLS